MGETTEERQSYLNGACSAWNIAVLPEHLREEALSHNIAEYKRMNLDAAQAKQKAAVERKSMREVLFEGLRWYIAPAQPTATPQKKGKRKG